LAGPSHSVVLHVIGARTFCGAKRPREGRRFVAGQLRSLWPAGPRRRPPCRPQHRSAFLAARSGRRKRTGHMKASGALRQIRYWRRHLNICVASVRLKEPWFAPAGGFQRPRQKNRRRALTESEGDRAGKRCAGLLIQDGRYRGPGANAVPDFFLTAMAAAYNNKRRFPALSFHSASRAAPACGSRVGALHPSPSVFCLRRARPRRRAARLADRVTHRKHSNAVGR